MNKAMLAVLLLVMALPCATGAEQPSADPRGQLQRIQESPPFQEWKNRQRREAPHVGVLDNISRSLSDLSRRISDFFKRDPNRRQAQTPPPPAGAMPAAEDEADVSLWSRVGWIGLVVLALLLCFILLKRLLQPPPPVRTARVLSRQAVEEAMEAGEALALAPAEWMDEARRLAAEQNFRAMYRALYLALLSGLHSNGKIEHNRHRTNWYYVQHYRGPIDERPLFEGLTDLFDRVWYGHKQPANANLDELQRQVAQLTATGEGQ